MATAIPTVAAGYAAAFGIFAAILTVRVILQRVKTGVQAGDGGQVGLAQAIRAHANFAEQLPLALLLLTITEWIGTARTWVIVLGAVLMLARLASAWGLSHSLGPTQPRQAGAGMTVLVVVACSLLIAYQLWVPH